MSERTWGMRFNQSTSYERLPKDKLLWACPDWFNQQQARDWQEAGIVVWNNVEKRTTHLSGNESLKLLNELTSNDLWKTNGVSITRLTHHFEIPIPRRGKRKKKDKDQEPVTETSKSEDVLEEILHLPPEAGIDLIEVLRTNETHISEMARQEKERFQKALKDLFDHVMEFHREKEQREFDFDSRTHKWESWGENRWKCLHQQNEGRVCLDKNINSWRACLHGRGPAHESHYFAEFQLAIEWAEQKLEEITHEPPEPATEPRIRPSEQIEADHRRLKQKLEGGPYWIKPAALEPERAAYQVFLEMESQPVDFKTHESVCGDSFRYSERYLTPLKQASALGLDFDLFEIVQPIGENSEWFQFTSLTTYYDAVNASRQAQNLWNQSRILHEFKAGRIIRARYGYKERETDFKVFMGVCENPDKAWEPPESRNEYMKQKGFRESLCFALDVNDYRDFLGVTAELISDERILAAMHRVRAKSKLIPTEISLESRLWLARQGSDE